MKKRSDTVTPAPSYTRILGMVEGHEAEVIEAFKLRGGNKTRWSRCDWVHMAAAITSVEDALELKLHKQTSPPQLRLQRARRLLEALD